MTQLHDNLLSPETLIVEDIDRTAADILPLDSAVTDPIPRPVNPARSAAGKLGGLRVHELTLLGREYEREHGLKAGRQRLKQLVQLGKRYEVEHGLRAPKPRKRPQGDPWKDFFQALSRIVKPAYRPTVERLVASLEDGPSAA